MLKKTVFHLLVLAVAVVVGTMLAMNLNARQEQFCQSRAQLSRAPLAGFHKLLADIKWIQLIQHCGSISKMDDKQAEEVNGMLQEMLRLDPDFGKGYKTGALMISSEAPDKALAILEAGASNPMLKSNWEIPYLAGFIHMRQIKGTSEEDMMHARKAKVYFQQALNANASQAYIRASLIRAEATLDKDKPKKLAELEAWYAYLESASEQNGPGVPSMMPGGMGRNMLGGPGVADKNAIMLRIIKLAQQCRTEMPNDPNVLKTTETIVSKLQADMHLCKKCYTPYAAGDKFCVGCGEAVETFGACDKCGHLAAGAFCVQCGNKLAKP